MYRKFFKRLFLLMMSLSFMTANVAYAEINITDFACVNGNYTVKGTAGKNEYVTMRVMKDGSDVRNYDDVLGVKETKSDDNGKFEITIYIPDEKNGADTKGKYNVTLATDDYKELQELDYSSKDERDALLKQIKDITSEAELKTIIFNESKNTLFNIGFEYSLINSEDNSVIEEAARMMYRNNNFTDITEEKIYNQSHIYLLLAKINLLGDEEQISVLEKINPLCCGTPYNELSEGQKDFVQKVISHMRKYNSWEEFEKICDTAVALSNVNGARYTQLSTVLEEYSEALGIADNSSYETYKKYSEADKKKVNQLMVKEFAKQNVLDTDELIEKLNLAADEVIIDSNTSKNTSGSSEKSGGTGNISMPVSQKQLYSNIQSYIKNTFSDVMPGSWYHEYVERLSQKGIISGYDDKSFKPDNNVTREEFIKMVVSMSGIKNIADMVKFTDVNEDKWYSKYISNAVSAGITKGISDNQFGVGLNLTREDAAVIICRAANIKGDVSAVNISDKENISDYALNSVFLLYNKGIVSGNPEGEFMPKNNITRAETAKILCLAFGG